MPFAAPQEGPYNLPFAFVASYAIAAVERYGKLAIAPTFVHVIVDHYHLSPVAFSLWYVVRMGRPASVPIANFSSR